MHQLNDGTKLAVFPVWRELAVQYFEVGFVRRLVVHLSATDEVISGKIMEMISSKEYLREHKEEIPKWYYEGTLNKSQVWVLFSAIDGDAGAFDTNKTSSGCSCCTVKSISIDVADCTITYENHCGDTSTTSGDCGSDGSGPGGGGNGSSGGSNGNPTGGETPTGGNGGGSGGTGIISIIPPNGGSVIPVFEVGDDDEGEPIDMGENVLLPPIFNPSSFIQAQNYDPIMYRVFNQAQNSSLSHLQKAAWEYYHKNKTNWGTIIGITAEAQVIKELLKSATGIAAQTAFANLFDPNAVIYSFENTKITHAPDKLTDMILTVNESNANAIFNIDFWELNGITYENVEYEFQGRTDFIIEVKCVSPNNSRVGEIVRNGLNQLLTNPRTINGQGKPLLILEKEAFSIAMQHATWGPIIRQLLPQIKAKGGGVQLIEGLNSRTNATKNSMIAYIRSDTAKPPINYYNGYQENPNEDSHELYD